MGRIAFADESGTDGKTKCYAIGVVSVAKNKLRGFNESFELLRRQHGVSQEAHWEGVNKGHGLINFGLDWLDRVLRSETARFDVIVVNTRMYRKWSMRANREEAFYQTYTYLLRHIARQVKVTTDVFIDDKSDRYPKRHEVVETIANRMLANLEETGRLERVQKVRSHDYPGGQVADMLTGAIAASHRLFLDSTAPVNPGKRLAIERMAELLGWDALHYDTYPESFPKQRFNIWHFPEEYRGMPGTRRISHRRLVPFVTRRDVEAARETWGATVGSKAG